MRRDSALSRQRGLKYRLLLPLLAGLIGIAAGCTGNNPAPPPTGTPDALALVTQAAANIRGAQSFRLTIVQTGPAYQLNTVQGAATFRQAEGQYVAPGLLQARVRVVVLGIPLDIDIFARRAQQWVRAVFTGNQWSDAFVFAEGFDPAALLADDTGFNAALNALIDLNYVGIETLETGASVHHLSGMATGTGMNALMVGLIQATGEVPVEVYIDTTTLQPVRFVLRLFEANPGSASIGMNPLDPAAAIAASGGDPLAAVAESTPETTAEAQTEPFVWILDLYDLNGESELDPPPEADDTATPEATQDTGA